MAWFEFTVSVLVAFVMGNIIGEIIVFSITITAIIMAVKSVIRMMEGKK